MLPFRKWSLPWLCALAVVETVACGVKPLADDSDSQAGSKAAASAKTGVNCGTDPDTGAELCLGTTECPDVLIDSDAFPGCGFHSTTKSYDLECVCNASELCPVGVASSCDEIAGLFAHRSFADVCNQAGGGACTPVARSSGRPSGSTPPGAASTCDRTCAADCEGAPACVQACGC